MSSDEVIQEVSTTIDSEAESLAQVTDRISLRAAWIVGVALALLVLVVNLGRNPIPLLKDHTSFGPISLYFLVPATFVVGWICFVKGVKAWNDHVDSERQRGWKMQVLPVSIAYALLVGLLSIVVLQLAEPAFPGLALDRFQASFVAGFAGATITYWIAKQAMLITSSSLLRLAIIIVGAGVYLAISSSDDPLWWQISFSSVGTHGTFTSWIFNSSLVFGGILVLVWMPYFINDFEILVRNELSTPDLTKWLYRGMYALGVTITLVGVFENQVSQLGNAIHNTAAPAMGVIVIILGFSLRKLVPGLPRDVHITSFILAGLLLLGVVFVMIGYFNTAGITIYGAAIAFTWLMLFVGTVEQIAEDLNPRAFPA
jgi:hypothetical protein